MSEEKEQVVFPSDGEILNSLLVKYSEELATAVTETEKALASVKQNLVNLERNSVGIRAQQALITKLKTDISDVKASLNNK